MSNAFKPNLSFKSLLLKLTMAVLILFAGPALAQDLKITGKVLDEKGQTIPGASVIVKGKTTGAATDVNGAFSIKVAKGDVLVVSYIGYKPTEQKISSSSPIEFVLELDNTKIDEVVVIGYGTIKKSDLTGSVASVKKEDLLKRATTNPVEALQGKVAGISIKKFGGNAGSNAKMTIHGLSTFGDASPLYIIDGFPGDITTVAPADIENLEILKDGAASAIYGSLAGNGVVIVTTRKGNQGKVKINFNSYLSFNKVDNKLDLLDAEGYKLVHKRMYEEYNRQFPNNPMALPEYINAKIDVNSNWQDAVLRNGLAQNYNLGITGGQDNLLFALSTNMTNDKGIFIGNQFKEKGGRMKLNFKKSILEVESVVSYRATDNEQPKFSFKETYMISPLAPIYDPSQEAGFGLTGSKYEIPTNRNPLAEDHFKTSWSKSQNFNGTIAATLKFTDWLQYKSGYSYNSINSQGYYHSPKYKSSIKDIVLYPYYSEDRTLYETQTFDNVLTFNKKIADHSINLIAGTSVTSQKSNWNSVSIEGKTTVYNDKGEPSTIPSGFLDEYFKTIDGGQGGTYNASGSKYEYNRLSYFGRMNYSFLNRYLLQATIRKDGSSKFGKDSRWGTFPSVALGWKITEEEFFPRNTVINNLKLRASWGLLGNESILGYYGSQPLIVSGNYLKYGYVQGSAGNPWPGSIATSFEDQKLQWESAESKNIGIDYSLFDSKLTGTLNFFINGTNDLLITKVLPASAGLVNPIMNVGSFENKGIEFELSYRNSYKEFNYNIGFNISYIKNEVTKLSSNDQAIPGEGLKFGTSHFPTSTKVGYPVGAFFLYETDGIFQSIEEVNAYVNSKGKKLQPLAQPGDLRFRDTNGDGVITDKDKTFQGSGMPKVEASLNLNCSYHGLDFSFLLGSGWGHKLYNANRYLYESMSSGSNFLSSTLNSWTPQNKNTDIPRAVLNDPNGNTKESDRFLENGDFIRLRNIQLGYSFQPSILKKVNIDNLRIYASGENIWTWTNYTGIDPEFARSSAFNGGIDNLTTPFTKSYVFGIQLTF